MATLVHFDIPADDLNRARTFYKELFDWKFTEIPGFVEYCEIETNDLKGKPSLGGGITKRESEQQTGITNFIGVDSIDKTLAKVSELGGKIIQAKQPIATYGYLAVCLDTEGNKFGVFQEDKNA
ncbi:VOC family protein [Fulvivirga sp. 29W222]|uniref:VOC family protein n=1 Tax=Fulvivirga marina TaxID=2494733 RepID=A0A937FXQ0_9BACT|nr:VOC family protein [Fulvivirga marina]MBL6448075.1 VOC family protein [Fulvivirga marina]